MLNPNFKVNINMRKGCFFLFICVLMCFIPVTGDSGNRGKEFYLRGAFYQDWLGFKSEGYELYSRLSSRLNLTFWNKPGDGWTASIDVRNRYTLGDRGKNQLIIYDARLTYDHLNTRLFFSLGQMNLYDTAGIGELTGGVLGYKLDKYLSLGGYAGIEPDIYNTSWETDANKFGFFVRYMGSGARQFSLSFNRLGSGSKSERQYLYSSLLLPLKRLFVLYGNLEYELDNKVKKEDRLSRLFLNARLDLSQYIDVTANYSSGRGLDYHQFLLDQSQNPTLQNSEIERFYYNEVYGVQVSIKPGKNVRLYVSRRESELVDQGIKNHTTRFGLSLANILRTGIYIYGNFNMNRGDSSESDSYYISLSRSFGKLSGSLSFANYYNGVRFSGEGTPQVFYLPERQTLSTNLFLILSRSLALALDYAYSYQEEEKEHQFFIRVIFRR